LTVVFDLSGFGEIHEVLACTSGAITGGAEGGCVPQGYDIANYFFQRAMIAQLELAAVWIALSIFVTAGIGTASSRDLRNSHRESLATDLRAFPGGHAHSGVRNSQAHDRRHLEEIVIAD
jgi:hypothetical protein